MPATSSPILTPDALLAGLGQPGLGWLIAAAFVAGMVRGFSGFGSGLVFLPVAAQILSPVTAIAVLTIADFFGALPILRRAARDADRADLFRLIGAMIVGLPIGVFLLLLFDPDMFRYAVSGLALTMVACLLTGIRYRGALTPGLTLVAGGMSGLLGGAVGIPGPPIILLYLASGLPAKVVRATTMLFLFSYDIFLVGLLAFNERLTVETIGVGIFLAIPNIIGNLAGAAIFRPGSESVYRGLAYGLIVLSALSGLPFWG